MLSTQQLTDLIKKGKGEAKERKFNEAVEVILTLREVDAKKADLNVNETVYLPHPASKVARICFIGAGDMAENVLAVVQAVEKKLPQGEKNIKSVIVKTSMGKPVKQAVGQR